MRREIVVIAASLGIVVSAYAGEAEDKGLKIATQVDAANQGFKGEKGEVAMELINAHGDVVARKMLMKIKEGSNDGDKSLVEFSWPPDVNGTRMLTWTHKQGDDDQWLYLPAIKRIKRISSRNKSGSFMGSEFAYEDLASQEVEKYTYKFLRDDTVDARKVWVMERYPTDKRSGYKRQIVWTDKEYMNVLKVEYYDRKDELLKTGYFEDYKKLGKFWRFHKIRMENAQTKKKSVFSWNARSLNVDWDDDEFESDALED